jgi:hypothetical protein
MNKLLHNKWVVSVLAVVAVAVLAMQFWPKSRAGSASRNKPPTQASTKPETAQPSTAKVATTNTSEPSLPSTTPESSADRDYLSERYEVWVAMNRDPFGEVERVLEPTEDEKTDPPASELLTVSGLWLQTGAKLAVVNGAVLGEGDKILHYTVELISFDGIEVEGRRGRESVFFDDFNPKKPDPPKGDTTTAAAGNTMTRT